MKPHAWQGKCIEAYDRCGGVWGGLDPGAGKTFAAAEIARRCARPLVLVPAGVGLRQTREMFEAYGVTTFEPLKRKLKRGEKNEGHAAFVSHKMMQLKGQQNFLEEYRPSDIIIDEAHMVQNLQGNSTAKRLNKHLVAHPEVRVAWFTGSPMDGDPRDLVYGLRYALRRQVPVPQNRQEIEQWTERMENDAAFRAAFLAELKAVDGVFLDTDGAGLYEGEVIIRIVRRPPAAELPADHVMPDGYVIEGPGQAATMAKHLAWGFWPRRTPRYSEQYLEARRTWAGVVKRCIASGVVNTESQVYDLRPAQYATWRAAEMAEGPGHEEAVWVTRDALYDALDRPLRGNTIVWAESVPVQALVAEYLMCPWHHHLGVDQFGVALNETSQPTVVASIGSCYQSFNAQHFNHNLVLEPPSSPARWRQLIGRTARQGQRSPTVTFDVVVNCPQAEAALRQAVIGARLDLESSGKYNPILQLEAELGLL